MKSDIAITWVALGMLIVLLLYAIFCLRLLISEQQRQIDQLCQMAFILAREQGINDQNGFIVGKEYCLIFADYNRNRAILGEFDQEISYDSKPRLIIMHNIDEKNLEYWDKQPIIYSKYKKIPR